MTPSGPASVTAQTVTELPTVDAWPRLAPAAFYGVAGRLVDVVSPFSEGDPVATLAPVLVGAGNCIGPTPHVKVQHDRHPARLFIAVVGDSSKARKGLSASTPRYVLSHVDPDWTRDRIRSGLSSGEGLIFHVRDERVERQAIREKGRVTDYQEVVVDHGEPDKRLFCIEPELASMFKRMVGETNSLSAVLRQAFDDLPLSTLTKNAPLKATGAHVSLIGHTTPDELRVHLSETERVNGFANRFLFLLVRRALVLPDGDAVPDHLLAPVIDEMGTVIARARTIGQVHRDPTAAELWRAIYPALSEGEPGLVGAVLGRGEAHVLRLSLVYALLDGSDMIRQPHLEAAVALWDYAAASARRIFGGRLGITVADTVLEVLRTRGTMTRSEIHGLFGRHRRADEISTALEALQAAGKVRPVTRETGGRPAESWEISYRDARPPPGAFFVLSHLQGPHMTYLDILNEAKVRLGLCVISEIREKSPSSSFVGGKENEAPGANEAQEAKEGPPDGGRPYAHPWPDAIANLGSRQIGPFAACAGCGSGTWARYGDRPLCLGCATTSPTRCSPVRRG